jgi:hypothetical protein
MCCKNIKPLILFVLLFQTAFAAETKNIQQIRYKFTLAIESSEKTEELLKYLDKLKSNEPLVIAYKGGTEALMAKHSWNPYQKFAYLKKSGQTLQSAIEDAPKNAEIRFLRFSIQHFIPSFLGMSGELEEDKKVIIANINTTTSGEVKKAIIKFMIESGRCNAAELNLLKMAV